MMTNLAGALRGRAGTARTPEPSQDRARLGSRRWETQLRTGTITLILVGAAIALAACGSSAPLVASGDCGSVLRYEGDLYWGTQESVHAGKGLGTGEEPACADAADSGSAGPFDVAVRTGLPVAKVPGVDPGVAVVLLSKEGNTHGLVFIQGEPPGGELLAALKRALKDPDPERSAR